MNKPLAKHSGYLVEYGPDYPMHYPPAQDYYQASEVEAWLEREGDCMCFNVESDGHFGGCRGRVIDRLLDRLRKGKG